MTKVEKQLNYLYEKYITEQSNAYYYGCGHAVEDLKKLFKLMNFKGKAKNE